MTSPASALLKYLFWSTQNNTKCLTRSLIENNGLSPAEWREMTIIITEHRPATAEEYKSD